MIQSRSSYKPAVAVVGSGAAGLSAAWLLSRSCTVTLFEQGGKFGGHADTVTLSDGQPVDMGFIVYNEATYPNLSAWFRYLDVATQPTEMSFSVSRLANQAAAANAMSARQRRFEYAGGRRGGLIAQPTNLLRPRFWSMLLDLVRFYRTAVAAVDVADGGSETLTLGEFLRRHGYRRAFIEDHLLPFGAAIWSSSQAAMLDYPLAAFVRFCDNHGLLKLANRPQWRTVAGGSREYVARVTSELDSDALRLNQQVTQIQRTEVDDSASAGLGQKSRVMLENGDWYEFDHVVLATHADQALALLSDADANEQRLLGEFAYSDNLAVLHTDDSVMPRSRRAWASWNYVEATGDTLHSKPTVSYWMNCLQSLAGQQQVFVSLNPTQPVPSEHEIRRAHYQHPQFNAATFLAQRQLWSLQGRRNTWFCGSYFGAGFHEDAVQSGFAVAEHLGGVKRPWQVDDESGRICVHKDSDSDANTPNQADARTLMMTPGHGVAADTVSPDRAV